MASGKLVSQKDCVLLLESMGKKFQKASVDKVAKARSYLAKWLVSGK